MKTRKMWIIGFGDTIISMSNNYSQILKEFKENYAGNPVYWMQMIIV